MMRKAGLIFGNALASWECDLGRSPTGSFAEAAGRAPIQPLPRISAEDPVDADSLESEHFPSVTILSLKSKAMRI
jgi:hypothetical protein